MAELESRNEGVSRDLSQAPIRDENVIETLEREIVPVLRDVRRQFNRQCAIPQIPVFDAAPVDADFGVEFENKPYDGVLAVGGGTLYCRILGVWMPIGP